MKDRLRCISYLSPSLPGAMFETILAYLEERLGIDTVLEFDTRTSGPLKGGEDPFSTARADLAFLCSPSYLWLEELVPSPVELVPAAPVFRDSRGDGKPVYFSEVVVSRASVVSSFEDLGGGRWAYNDTCSLSGYYNLLMKLAGMGSGGSSFFGEIRHSGSHLASLALVAAGECDAAAIDSNVLALQRVSNPELTARLRVIESWGPYPIQPVVLRATLPRGIKQGIVAALLQMALHSRWARALSNFGIERFAPISGGDYAREREVLSTTQGLQGSIV